jgi:hypothetical protein
MVSLAANISSGLYGLPYINRSLQADKEEADTVALVY